MTSRNNLLAVCIRTLEEYLAPDRMSNQTLIRARAWVASWIYGGGTMLPELDPLVVECARWAFVDMCTAQGPDLQSQLPGQSEPWYPKISALHELSPAAA